MSKRGYLLAALVVLVAIAALKLWADDSWLSQGTQGSAQSSAPTVAPQAAPEVAVSAPAPTPSSASSAPRPEANSPAPGEGQSLIPGALLEPQQSTPDVFKGNPEDGPHAVYPELVYEAGTVEAGTELTHTFRVKNTGKADLLIHQVKPGCGCTISDFTKVVPPGQEGRIILTVKTEGMRGAIQKSATVHSNDPANPMVTLSIKGTVKQLIDILPAPYINIRVSQGQPVEGTVTLVNNDRTPLHILEVKSSNPEFATHLKTVEKGQRYELQVKLNGAKTVGGRFNTQLTVTTNNKKQPQLNIPVIAVIAARVEAFPERLTFGRLHLASLKDNPQSNVLLTRTITVRSLVPEFKVTHVESSLPFVQLQLVAPQRPGSPYNVRVALVKEKLRTGPFEGTITLRTNDREFSQLKIPLSGEVN